MAGGLIRDRSGNWVMGFQWNNIVATSNTAVECRALRDGLKLALEHNLSGILVETDSLTFVHLLKPKVLGNHELSNIFTDCRMLLDRFGAEVCHVFWEAN